MRKNSFSQLGLFDSTSLGWGFDLGIGGSPGAGRYETVQNMGGEQNRHVAPLVVQLSTN